MLMSIMTRLHLLPEGLEKFYLHDAQLIVYLIATFGLEEIEFSGGRFGHLDYLTESIAIG